MRILLVSQYFWPESFIINDLVRVLLTAGHCVEVLTGKPNYPDGKVFQGYSANGCSEELFDDSVRVYRVPIYPRGVGGAKNLLMNYLSFVINGLRFFPKAVRNRSYDVVFVYAPSPITSAIPAIYLKCRLRTHLAIWVQDLWPESLSATGFIRSKWLLGGIGWLVRLIYGYADTLLVQSRAFGVAVSKYAKASKVIYYPNSCLDMSPTPQVTSGVPAELMELLERDFCLVFAGNLGSAQALETVIQAVDKLRDLIDLKLVLVGSGSRLPWLEKQKIDKGLDNLILAGRFSSSEMHNFFSRAAGLLVTLKNEEIFSYTIPSKIQAYLAAGRPIIASLNGEGARVIEEAKAGFTCPAENVDALAACIRRLYCLSPLKRDQLGRSGRAYFVEHFEMKRQARKLIEILERRVAEGVDK